MTAQLSPTPIFKGWSNDGQPLAYGRLTTYKAGTTIKQAAYTDSTQTQQLTNPAQLDFRGETPLWLDPSLIYKFVLTDLFGNTIPGYPVDNIPGGFGALPISASLIPNPTNTWTLGNSFFSWANLYLGPNNAPVYDSTSGNIGYYARTAAEIAAGVMPTDYSYVSHVAVGYVHPKRYGDNLATCVLVAAQLGGAEIHLEPIVYAPLGSGGAANMTTPNVKFIGAKRPYFNAAGTGLQDGSIIQGPLIYQGDNVEFRDLGVDSGSAVCTALYAGVAQEGLICSVTYLSGQPQFNGLTVQNVVAMCQAPAVAFHAFACEGYSRARIDNVETLFGTHGQAYKVIGSQVTNVRSRGNSSEGIVIKSDAIRQCYQSSFAGIFVTSYNANDTTNGVAVEAQGSQTVHDIVISNAVCTGVSADGFNLSNDSTSGALNLDIEFIGCHGILNGGNGFNNTDAASQRIKFIGCTGNTNTGFGFTDVANSSYCRYLGCTADNNIDGFVNFGLNVDVSDCTASNNTNYGFYAKTGASVFRLCNTGTGNASGLYGADTGINFFSRFIPPSVTAVTSFLNSWVNFGSSNTTAAYSIDDSGIVRLQGLIKSGTIGSAAFILPTGFRPQLTVRQAVTTFNGSNVVMGETFVDSSGNVTPSAGSNSYVSLDGITFRTY